MKKHAVKISRISSVCQEKEWNEEKKLQKKNAEVEKCDGNSF